MRVAGFQEDIPLAEAGIPKMLGFCPVMRFVYSRKWFAGDEEKNRENPEGIEPEVFKPREFGGGVSKIAARVVRRS